jgi:quercetin dioxygenase-like cupin family protein
VTDDEVIFTVGGEERNIKEGEIFEIDNSNKLHSVINNSEEIDRVHLLADWLTT